MGQRVLHCYADYKWTGPSEPVAVLCRELSRRGWSSELTCIGPRPGHERLLPTQAREMGVTVHDGFRFDRVLHIRSNHRDVKALRQLIEGGEFALVHAHGSRDHVLAALALRGRRGRIPLVRTDQGARDYTRGPLHRCQFGRGMTDHLIVLSDRLRARAVDKIGRAPGSVTTVRGAVDASEFCPATAPDGLRENLGFADSDVVIGIVARVQRHRRFEVLIEAALTVKERNPHVKIAVLGRGTRKKILLDDPVEQVGLRDTVFPLGYHVGDYRDVLATFDAGMMLVPGTDGSCRAAMQMAAMGKPLLVAQRGVLPDIVQDGRTGIVVNDTPSNLAEAILEMAESAERRREWGQAARERMLECFSLDRQAERVIAVYEKVLK